MKRILVPLDGSGFGEQALPTALNLARRDHAEIELVHVYESVISYSGVPVLDPALALEVEKDRVAYLETVAEWLGRDTGVTITPTVLGGDRIAPTLVSYLGDRRPDLVVMATHGRGGLSRFWLGSVTSELVRQSPAPVLLIHPTAGDARTRAPETFHRVLVALDATQAAEEALDHALAVVGSDTADFMLVHVVVPVVYVADVMADMYPTEDDIRELEAYLAAVAGRLRARGHVAETRLLRDANPARAILDEVAKERADLVALETYAPGRLERLLVGSVADKVMRASPVPVLVHRPAVVDDDEREPVRSKSAESKR